MADDMQPTAPVKGKRGGARVGAGRPCKTIDVPADADPLVYLQALMVSKISPEPLRLKAAIALAAYKHAKRGAAAALGKKEQKLQHAHDLASQGGTYSSGRPPLSVVRKP